MPSFRVIMTMGSLRPGVAPDRVQAIASEAAAQLTTVEASSVNVVRGQARLTVRFEAEDDELAEQIAGHVVGATDSAAEVLEFTVTVQRHGGWLTVRRA
jgi:hypothetical protein